MGPHEFEKSIIAARRDAVLHAAGVTSFEDTGETMDAAFDDWRGCKSRAVPLIAAILADEYSQLVEERMAAGGPMDISIGHMSGMIFNEALPLAMDWLPDDDGFPVETPFQDPSIGFRKWE